MSWLQPKPLLSDEEFSKILLDDSDAGIWLALVDAARNHDPVLNRIFSISQRRGWSRFRTVMVCAYVMAQRNQQFIQREMDRLMMTAPSSLIFCSKCSAEITAIKEPSAPKSENCTH